MQPQAYRTESQFRDVKTLGCHNSTEIEWILTQNLVQVLRLMHTHTYTLREYERFIIHISKLSGKNWVFPSGLENSMKKQGKETDFGFLWWLVGGPEEGSHWHPGYCVV